MLSEIIFYENYIYVRKYYYIDINSSKKIFFSDDINDIYTYSQTGESIEFSGPDLPKKLTKHFVTKLCTFN